MTSLPLFATAAMQYVLSITAEVEKILLGSAATDPTNYGMTTEEEKAACSGVNVCAWQH